MQLNLLKKPFAVLCLILASSSYAAAVPADIQEINAPIAIQAPEHKYQLYNDGQCSQSDDSDIKELREEEAPIRDARPIKLARPY
ncbi:hypothetical protein [Acinetobacter pragensis]|uniref:Uncharacterized protein n=1 Tax=Acinetobacter pragensis TaxID=1806892 RepID=A0A151Y266_9GAMM|nr:hypothetical protein [Acinetobacter pragensis]KYQ72097.1 hypothetical protein AZH43_12880 [Acinetobacter pragensis]